MKRVEQAALHTLLKQQLLLILIAKCITSDAFHPYDGRLDYNRPLYGLAFPARWHAIADLPAVARVCLLVVTAF